MRDSYLEDVIISQTDGLSGSTLEARNYHPAADNVFERTQSALSLSIAILLRSHLSKSY